MVSIDLKNLCFFMGISLKPFDGSWLAIWSHFAFVFVSIALIVMTLLQLNIEFEYG